MESKVSDITFVRGMINYLDLTDKVMMFGGCVRDMMLGIAPKDIDVLIGNSEHYRAIKKFLVASHRLRGVELQKPSKELEYSVFSLEIETPLSRSLKIDLARQPDQQNLCDFTCNNLMLT